MAAVPAVTEVAGRPRAELLAHGKRALDQILWHPECPHRLSSHIPTLEEVLVVIGWARKLGCVAIHVEPCGTGLLAHELAKHHANVTASDASEPPYSFVTRAPDRALALKTLLVIPDCGFDEADVSAITRRPWAAVAVLSERPGTGGLAHVNPQVWHTIMARGIPVPTADGVDADPVMVGGGWMAVDRAAAPSYHWADPVLDPGFEDMLAGSFLKAACCRRVQELYERTVVARPWHGDTHAGYDGRYEHEPLMLAYEWISRLKAHGAAAIVRPPDLDGLRALLRTLVGKPIFVEVLRELPKNAVDIAVVHAALRRLKLAEMPEPLARYKVALADPDLDNPFKRQAQADVAPMVRLLIHAPVPVCHACLATPPQHTLKRCSRCRVAEYCDAACHKAHWSLHSARCRRS